MKKLTKIIASAALMGTLAMGGCNEDDFIKAPLDQVSSSNYWTNETNANLALTTAYQRLNGGVWSHTEVNFMLENFRSDFTKAGSDVVANYPDQNAFSIY